MQAIPTQVFKAYDIRGVVPQQLNEDFAYLLGRALAQKAMEQGIQQAVVGYDGRTSSPQLTQALLKGMHAEGLNTISLTMVPTPLVYFVAYSRQIGLAVAITGSHNPSDYNGFKMMLAGKSIYGDEVLALRERMEIIRNNQVNFSISANDNTPNSAPTEAQVSAETINIVPAYLERICNDIKLARPMKIAIDCGNGVGAAVAGQLYEQLGCCVDKLYCEVDGTFPNHHPDPAEPHNLEALINHVKNTDCELGLAFDGDADRLGVITKNGQIIWPDRQLILFARDILQRNPGATVIYDVKCSRHVAKSVKAMGGNPLMWKTGHSLIKSILSETGAPIAGEMSGHIFFKERWYGFDDGLYAGARLLEIVSCNNNPSAILEALPQDISTPELKIEMQEGEPHTLIKRLQQESQFPAAQELNYIDGVRAEYTDGFGLARASNTTPVIVLRFEAETTAALQRIQDEFKQAISLLAPQVNFPW